MPGEMFGRYRVHDLLGRGGMGDVHRAYDTVRKRLIALKRLPPQLATDPEFQARFRREAEVAARLTEPHVIPIHDFGEIDGIAHTTTESSLTVTGETVGTLGYMAPEHAPAHLGQPRPTERTWAGQQVAHVRDAVGGRPRRSPSPWSGCAYWSGPYSVSHRRHRSRPGRCARR